MEEARRGHEAISGRHDPKIGSKARSDCDEQEVSSYAPVSTHIEVNCWARRSGTVAQPAPPTLSASLGFRVRRMPQLEIPRRRPTLAVSAACDDVKALCHVSALPLVQSSWRRIYPNLRGWAIAVSRDGPGAETVIGALVRRPHPELGTCRARLRFPTATPVSLQASVSIPWTPNLVRYWLAPLEAMRSRRPVLRMRWSRRTVTLGLGRNTRASRFPKSQPS